MVNFYLTRDLHSFAGERDGDDGNGNEHTWHYQTQKTFEVSVVHKSHFVVHLIVSTAQQLIRSVTQLPTHHFGNPRKLWNAELIVP